MFCDMADTIKCCNCVWLPSSCNGVLQNFLDNMASRNFILMRRYVAIWVQDLAECYSDSAEFENSFNTELTVWNNHYFQHY